MKDKTRPRRINIDTGVSQLNSGHRDCSRDGGSSHSHSGRAGVCDDLGNPKNVVLILTHPSHSRSRAEHVSAEADLLASTIESELRAFVAQQFARRDWPLPRAMCRLHHVHGS